VAPIYFCKYLVFPTQEPSDKRKYYRAAFFLSILLTVLLVGGGPTYLFGETNEQLVPTQHRHEAINHKLSILEDEILEETELETIQDEIPASSIAFLLGSSHLYQHLPENITDRENLNAMELEPDQTNMRHFLTVNASLNDSKPYDL